MRLGMFSVTIILAKQGTVPGTKSMLSTVAVKTVIEHFGI